VVSLPAIFSFKTYTATARILPPKEEAGGLGSVGCGPFGGAAAVA
jgi:hypothetical protein